MNYHYRYLQTIYYRVYEFEKNRPVLLPTPFPNPPIACAKRGVNG